MSKWIKDTILGVVAIATMAGIVGFSCWFVEFATAKPAPPKTRSYIQYESGIRTEQIVIDGREYDVISRYNGGVAAFRTNGEKDD